MSPRLLGGLAASLLLAAATSAGAQVPRPFGLQTFEPPPAGDRFLTVNGAEVPAHLAPAAALVLAWAADPLVLRVDGAIVPGGRIVHRQFWGYAQGAIGLAGRVLVEATLPVALSQSGSRPIPDLPQVSSTAMGDLRLGARLALPRLGPLTMAVAADLWVPAGSRDAFASDGSARLGARAIAAGESGHIEYGGQLGLLWRSSHDLVVTSTGSALTYALAAAWRQGPWRAGPELYGRVQFEGKVTSPAEVLLAGHWSQGPFDTALAVGTQLDRAPGAAPYRVIARVTWRPPPSDEPARLAAERAAAERAAAEKEAAERAAAERAAAEKAAAEKAAAERAAAEWAAAERAAAERAAAERAAAEKAAAEAARRPAAPVLVKLTKERIELLQTVRFEVNRDAIRPESEPLLSQVAGVLVTHPELSRVLIEGHTDSQGDHQLNMRLSEARARAVKTWLVAKERIDPTRLDAWGFGPDRPIDSNATAAGRARNRRVEFKIVEQVPAP